MIRVILEQDDHEGTNLGLRLEEANQVAMVDRELDEIALATLVLLDRLAKTAVSSGKAWKIS
jgi:hypothetical protein